MLRRLRENPGAGSAQDFDAQKEQSWALTS